MAKQIGIFQIAGTIDNTTFLQTEDGYIVKKKSRLTGETVKTDPRFARTQENFRDFKTAAESATLLKKAFYGTVQHARDSRTGNRLLGLARFAMNADTINPRGSRTVADGNLQIFDRFEFNIKGRLDESLNQAYTTAIDRATGELSLDIAAFVPKDTIMYPYEATHFRIVLAGAEVNFSTGFRNAAKSATAYLPIDQTATGPVALTVNLTAASVHPIFLAVGIEYYLELGATKYPMKNGKYNALAIRGVDG